MTISINPQTVATSIAALSISGVTMKGLDGIPDAASMLCPIVFPRPDLFITEIKPERQSFGGGGTSKMNFTYTLHYVFLYAQTGGGLGAFAPYNGMITALDAIIEKMLQSDNLSGLVDMEFGGIEGLGVIDDPAGNKFWGCFFSLDCLEFAQ